MNRGEKLKDDFVVSSEIPNNIICIVHNENLQHTVFTPTYHKEKNYFWITLGELWKQIEESDYRGTVMLIVENYTHGEIYCCGNYRVGEWYYYGDTMGFA